MITLPYPNTDPLLNHPSLPDHLPLSPLFPRPFRNLNPHPLPTPPSLLLPRLLADPVPRTTVDPVLRSN